MKICKSFAAVRKWQKCHPLTPIYSFQLGHALAWATPLAWATALAWARLEREFPSRNLPSLSEHCSYRLTLAWATPERGSRLSEARARHSTPKFSKLFLQLFSSFQFNSNTYTTSHTHNIIIHTHNHIISIHTITIIQTLIQSHNTTHFKYEIWGVTTLPSLGNFVPEI